MSESTSDANPAVGIIMGSRSDWPTLKAAADVLDALHVPYETKVVSAHRTPKRLYDYAATARERGLKVIIAGAGGAAHLPGMTASMTELPVLGVPVESRTLKGLDSLLSIAQMPAGVPVGTLAIGKAGATNAGLLAAGILALRDSRLATRLAAWRATQTASVSRDCRGPCLRQTLPPGSTIGILGGGQLGRMLSVAASRLGLKTHIYNDEPDAPAFDVAAETTVGAYDDPDAIAAFAEKRRRRHLRVRERAGEGARDRGPCAPVFPPPKSFAVAQDRLVEKDFVSGLGIAVAPYAAVDSLGDLQEALARVRPPALLKTRRFGYDGKGQVMIHTLCEAETAWETIGAAPSVLEGRGALRARGLGHRRARPGRRRCNSTTWSRTCIRAASSPPAACRPASPSRTVFEARKIAGKIAEALGHVGVLCVEMFQREGETPHLIVNEIAPRVHNSGHWTIDACLVSQFENHVRAICGWPLGDVGRHSDAVMTNLIGADVDDWRDAGGRARHGRPSLRQGRSASRPQDGPCHPLGPEDVGLELCRLVWTIRGAFC